ARVTMGVPGLDEMMGGGLPRGYSLLVAGPSGSGKSILAAAFLQAGVAAGETGVIAAFERRPTRLRNPALAQAIEKGQIGLVESHAPDISIEEVMQMLSAEVRRRRASRVVIDSLSGFELALGPSFREDFRESLLRPAERSGLDPVQVKHRRPRDRVANTSVVRGLAGSCAPRASAAC
ncbi:hypothetical protein FKK32_29535, partial [Klebsiella pneumoniae]|nr:hypothetical protein [Klebsiella pneumoniae]